MTTRIEVLTRFGLASCLMTTIEPEQTPGFPNWRVRINCTTGESKFFEVGEASQLAEQLRLAGEIAEAEKIEIATEAARQKMRPWTPR